MSSERAPDTSLLVVPLLDGTTLMITWGEVRSALAAQGLHVISAAEKAVLDEMGQLGTPMLELIRDGYSALPQVLHPPCLAELARREAKRGE